MTTFCDPTSLEEELSRVGCSDEDLDFEYLFEYEPPCSDAADGGQGLSDAFVALRGLSVLTRVAPDSPRVPETSCN